MIHALLALAMGLFLAWHPATRQECDAEFERELVWMGEAGWQGDPPISMGMAQLWFGSGHSKGYSTNPCGYSDGISFREKTELWDDEQTVTYAEGHLLYAERGDERYE